MLCKTCGNMEKLVTPIMAYCSHCDVMRPTNIAPPVPILVRAAHIPPAVFQETDQLGSETVCTACGGPEIKVTPITALCQACNRTRSLVVKPDHDPAREEAIRRELILVRQVLRTRGLPRLEAAKFQSRLTELEAQCQ